jgi:hypothetical protein
VFPLVGSDGVSSNPSAPPEGVRIRIKKSVDLGSLNLSPSAVVVAQALQDYGGVIGDQSGDNVILKVENTVAEGRGRLWEGVLNAGSLSAIRLDDFKVVRRGYRPKSAAIVETPMESTSAAPSSAFAAQGWGIGPNPLPTPLLAIRPLAAAGVSPDGRAIVSVERASGRDRPKTPLALPPRFDSPYGVGRSRPPP